MTHSSSVSVRVPPALQLLLKLQWIALLRRFKSGLTSPRKLVLSSLAVLLACFWLGNAVVSILLREPYGEETFRHGLLACLTAYFLWPIVKAACKRPPQAIEWSDSERELVCLGPFTRQELLSYRACVIFSSTFIKSACVTTLLLTDLRSGWLGFVGVLLALTFLDFARMATEEGFWGLGPRMYQAVRCIVLTAAGLAILVSVVATLRVATLEQGTGPAAFALILQFGRALVELFDTSAGQVLTAAFVPFANVIMADGLSLQVACWLIISVLMVAGAWRFTLWVDQTVHQVWLRRSIEEPAGDPAVDSAASCGTMPSAALPIIARLGGAGPIAWRQWLGARAYLVSLMIALVVPALLSWLPLASDLSPINTFLNVVGALAFYSFLLLPAALKFDFRRDCDRLPILKTLPIAPSAVVIGQLATPVILATLLQLLVLVVVMIVRPVSFGLALGAIGFFIPINIVIFGLDNLIFLLYPHRLNQEGIQVFLRVTLTFTAKGLLFGIALAIIYLWAVSVRTVAELPIVSLVSDHRIVFGMGLWGLATLIGLMLLCLLTWAFSRYDPSMDAPAN